MVSNNHIGIDNIIVNHGSERDLKDFWSDCVNNVSATHHHENTQKLLSPESVQQRLAGLSATDATQLCFFETSFNKDSFEHPAIETTTQAFFTRFHEGLYNVHQKLSAGLDVHSIIKISEGKYEWISVTFRKKNSETDNDFYASVKSVFFNEEGPEIISDYLSDNLHEWTFTDDHKDAFTSFAEKIQPGNALSVQCALNVHAGKPAVHEWLKSLAGTALALHHRTIPSGSKHPELSLPEGYFLYDAPTPWIHTPLQAPTASCFALNGSYFSAIRFEEVPLSAKPKLYDTKADLFTFSALSKEAITIALDEFIAWAEMAAYPEIQDLAREKNLREPLPYRIAIVASGKEDLLEKLKKTAKGIKKNDRSSSRIKNNAVWNISGTHNPKIAGIFPGQGAQHLNMLKALCLRFPEVRNWFDHLDASLVSVNGILPSLTIFPPAVGLNDTQRESLQNNLYSQEGGSVAVIVSSIALNELLQSFGCHADLFVGHSSGEISAMLISKSLRFDTKEQLFETILSINQKGAQGDSRGEIPKGKFLAVTAADENVLNDFIRKYPDDVYLAMDNCPQQKVLFFPNANFEQLHAELISQHVICMLLYFDRAYHTDLFEVEMPSIRAIYESFDFYAPQTPIFSCITLDTFPGDPQKIREQAALNWTYCVRFREACQLLAEKEGVNVFIEMGPGGVLSGFVDNTLNQTPHKALVTEQEGQDAYVQLLNVLANLFIEGVDVKLDGLYEQHATQAFQANNIPSPVENMVAALSIDTQVTPALEPISAYTNNTPANMQTKSAIVQQHFALMNEFMEAESRILDTILSQKAKLPAVKTRRAVPAYSAPEITQPVAPADTPVNRPMVDRVLYRDERTCICERTISRNTDLFLQHHTFGRFILKQPKGTTPLPVVPLAMIIEMMAEAASVAAPGYIVSEIINMSAMRWMTVDEISLTLHIESKLISKPGDADIRFMVSVLQKDDVERPYCKAIVLLKKHYSAAPSPMPITATVPETTLWDAESFFEQCLFHGNAFSSIDELLRLGDSEIEVQLNVPNKDILFTGNTTPEFITPAQLLDVPGHVTAYWQVEHGDEYFGIFPISIDRLQFYAPPAAPGTKLIARAKNEINDAIITTEFELLTPDESVCMKISGFKTIYYKLESSLLKAHYWTNPNAYFCNELIIEDDAIIGFEANTIKGGFQEQGSGIWLSSLLHMYCNAAEREQWQALPDKGKRRTEWLLGRIAAKEIVRKWAFFNHCIYILCPDIEIRYDAEGRPFVVCEELAQKGIVPDISLSHSNMQAVAIATEPYARVGVDMEYFRDEIAHDPKHLEIAFDADELSLISDSTIGLRAFVCAKEAAGKAIGTGVLGSLSMWKITGYTDNTVQVTILDTSIEVTLQQTQGQVIAYCTVPQQTAARIKKEILNQLYHNTINENL